MSVFLSPNILVSIVVPVYNVEKFLDRCMDTIVNQTYKNIEIILVDDGSSDKSSEMCDNWAKKDERVKVIHKENQGAGMARNTGIENAVGDYICFFDSDDYVALDLVEKCINVIKKNRADAIMFAHATVDSKGNMQENNSMSLDSLVYEGKEIQEELLPELISHDYRKGDNHGYALSVWTSMFSLSVIKDAGILFMSERVVYSEDSVFLIELYSKFKSVRVIPEFLYFHYENEGSLSFTPRIDSKVFMKEALAVSERVGYSSKVKGRIISLYHTFVIVTLKLIFLGDRNDKKRLMKNILTDNDLRNTLKFEFLATEKRKIKIFFLFAKIKLYFLCYWMLKVKMS